MRGAILLGLFALCPPALAGEAPVPDSDIPTVWRHDAGEAVPPGIIRVAGHDFRSMRLAAAAVRDGGRIDIGPGIYRQPLVIRAHDVRVRGHGGAVIEYGTAEGKAAIITKGDRTHISHIECRYIAVPHQNGACVRHEGRDLTLEHVYFHNAEQGLLAGRNPGTVSVRHSRFERLGKAGRAHGIYVGGGVLHISHSRFLASRDEGHEIKSRAPLTVIEHSVVASLDGRDSRLLDISQGGTLVMRGNVLQQGPNTSNLDLIGFALERSPYAEHRVELVDNTILVDSPRPGRLFHAGVGIAVAPVLRGNRVVGPVSDRYPGPNQWLDDRAAAGLPPYPALPPVPDD